MLIILFSLALAIFLGLADLRLEQSWLESLVFRSIFILWVSLTTAASLCLLSRAGLSHSRTSAAWTAMTTVLLMTAAVSLVVVSGPEWLTALSPMAVDSATTFVLRNLGIALLGSWLFLRHWALVERWRDQFNAESQTRLQALQARIRPHFLFNTLNTIASLIPERPVEAEQATMDLADLLRSGLKDEVNHSLGDELDLVRGYLRIESLRLGERLLVEWALDEDLPLQRPVPALLLQPLIENAIVHGIARRSDGGVLRIIGSKRRLGQVRFVIENPLADRSEPAPEGARMALENIRQRLALTFGQGGRLKTESQDGLFRVTLDLPALE